MIRICKHINFEPRRRKLLENRLDKTKTFMLKNIILLKSGREEEEYNGISRIRGCKLDVRKNRHRKFSTI
jgi:hypothetical protein